MSGPLRTTWLLAALTTLALALPAREEAAIPPVEDVGLAALREDPLPWLGKRVRFVLQLEGARETWNPYLSRFGPADWRGLRAWPDEGFTWEAEVFRDPHSWLFVRRESDAARVLAEAGRYHRLRAVGVVRELFLNEPWIEVESLHPLPTRVSEGTILHVERALKHLDQGSWKTAREQLERARAAPLPEHVLREIERLDQLIDERKELVRKARKRQR